MARSKKQSIEARNLALETSSREAENHLAASTSENRNQKGHVPNSPSTG
ncbi:hypothetical protein [Paenibacillus nasutitermitis]|uniref:Uncharacterized protein n=1 Tax=Paenibacillus nasutitermitis TaxID=1652958 RepID=A0A916YR08_9BACL|nr:hypothetical protein [Paenibacillus nasutitermitis]GGD57073.1 hypothetical protein GCM10010911_13540 [Paenibacillus nasutitermitis]